MAAKTVLIFPDMTVRCILSDFTNFQARPVLLRKKKGIHGKYIITKSMVHEFFCEVLTKISHIKHCRKGVMIQF